MLLQKWNFTLFQHKRQRLRYNTSNRVITGNLLLQKYKLTTLYIVVSGDNGSSTKEIFFLYQPIIQSTETHESLTLQKTHITKNLKIILQIIIFQIIKNLKNNNIQKERENKVTIMTTSRLKMLIKTVSKHRVCITLGQK